MIVPEIETPRLKLRAFTEADIPELLPLIGAREIAATTLRIAHPYTEQNARDFLAKARDEDKIWLAIIGRADGALLGGVGLMLELEHQRAELGYWVGVPYWGNGYATEAAQAMLQYGFEALELHRILAACMTHNSASGKILVKLGMRHEGCQREHQRKWGQFVDVDSYGILRSEWTSQGRHRKVL
jgi:RimJ/RimL family protein N-acetyltransferase